MLRHPNSARCQIDAGVSCRVASSDHSPSPSPTGTTAKVVPCADGCASVAVADGGGGGALADAGAGRERIQANSEEYASSICEGICVPAIADPPDTAALPGTALSAVVRFERQSCAAEGRGIPVAAEVLRV